MKTIIALFLVLATTTIGQAQDDEAGTCAGVRLGPVLCWSLGDLHNVSATTPGEPYVTQSFPQEKTHLLGLNTPGNANKKVVLGFNRHGGGYGWSARMTGFAGTRPNEETGARGYGRGMLGSIRDDLHFGDYNPIQSGVYYDRGVATKVIERPTYVWVPQFQAPLWDQNQGVQNRSEFDFSSFTEDVTATFGIPAFSEEQYYVWARQPDAITDFAVDTTKKISDISSRPGIQRPANTDMSEVVHTLKGIRPPAGPPPDGSDSGRPDFKYLFYRKTGTVGWTWHNVDLLDLPDDRDLLTCGYNVPVGGRSYIYTNPAPGTNPNVPMNSVGSSCSLDYPLYILSTSNGANAGSAVGLYIPHQDPMNNQQSRIIDKGNNSTVLQEDRRLEFLFQASNERDYEPLKGGPFRLVVARQRTAGLLSKSSAATAYGSGKFEALTQKSIVLYGTVNQIFNAVQDYEAGQ